MKWELDDNARSGLHYLLLGVVVMVLVRLGWIGLYSWSYHGIPNEERIFRHGYLGLEGITTVVQRYTPLERLSGALGLCILVSLAIGSVAALLSDSGRGLRFRISLWATLALMTPWAIWASLFCPAKRTVFKHDTMFIYYHRTTVMDLPLPFTGTQKGFDTSEILGLRAGHAEAWSSGIGCVSEILVRTRSGEEVIGSAWLNKGYEPHELMAVEWLTGQLIEKIDQTLGLSAAKDSVSAGYAP